MVNIGYSVAKNQDAWCISEAKQMPVSGCRYAKFPPSLFARRRDKASHHGNALDGPALDRSMVDARIT